MFMNCQGLPGFPLVKCVITVSSIAWRTFFSNVKYKVKQLFKINIKHYICSYLDYFVRKSLNKT